MTNRTQLSDLKNPEVSVIMGVYNDEGYLSDSILSILNQSITNFEFIIIDDASTDASSDILKKFANKDKRIQLHTNKINKGLTKNLNYALEIARGDYIARMDGDDIALPKRFEKQIKALRENEDAILCGTWTTNINAKSKEISKSKAPLDSYEFLWSSLFRATIAHPTVMMNNSLLSRHNLKYNENLRTAQDFDFWSQLQTYGKVIVLPEYLLKYRTHSDNVSHQRKGEQAKIASNISFNNIMRYFSAMKYEIDKKQLEEICNFIFLSTIVSKKNLKKNIKTILELQTKFIELNRLNDEQQTNIKKLTVRWLIQAIFTKRKSDILFKAYGTFLLMTEIKAIYKEFTSFISRRF